MTIPLAAFLGSAAGGVISQRLAHGPAPQPAPPPPAIAANTPPTPPAPPGDDPDGLPPIPAAGRSPFSEGPAFAAPSKPSAPGGDNHAAADGAKTAAAAIDPGDDPIAEPAREMDLPPAYFDITKFASTKGDGTDPPILKPGQYVMIEVLEALPGRPITGHRLIRPDGTVSLYFYGDLAVAGLNRNQIKIKVLERMKLSLSHTILGIEAYRDDKRVLVPAIETQRVCVDESINFEPHSAPPTPTRVLLPDPNDELREQVKALNLKVETLLRQDPKPGAK